jgi:PadR family transcriptional regulator PadR
MSVELQHQIRKGSTPVLILSLLLEQPMYGYQMARELTRRSQGYFQMQEGLLYPALHQMEREGLVRSEWLEVAGARRRRYYSITDEGRGVLADSIDEWMRFTDKLLQMIGRQHDVATDLVPG